MRRIPIEGIWGSIAEGKYIKKLTMKFSLCGCKKAVRMLLTALIAVKTAIFGAGDRDRTGTRGKPHRILSPGRLPVPPHQR